MDVEVGEAAVVVGGALLVGLSSELVVLVDVGVVLVRVGAGGSASVRVLAGGVEEDADDDDEDGDVDEGSSFSAVLLVGCSVCESSVEDVLGSCGCALGLCVGSVALLGEDELELLSCADSSALLDGLLVERVLVLSVVAGLSSSSSSSSSSPPLSPFPPDPWPSSSPPLSNCLLRSAAAGAAATETCSG